MIKVEELVSGCMAKALSDEMTFVLLARDIAAPSVIRYWAVERVRCGRNKWTDEQIVEALECADAMEATRLKILDELTL